MASTFDYVKEKIMEDSAKKMGAEFKASQWTSRQKIALTCRILFERGHFYDTAGQISVRAEDPGTYFTQQLGLGFDEITAGNLLLVDEDLNVLDGPGMANPANRFHSWVYRARPDVQCIVHSHAPYVSALSMLGQPLAVAHMDSVTLYDDCAFLPEWPGIPYGNEEGEIISATLQDKRAILLAHHGYLVACSRVEEACFLADMLERAAMLQILAAPAGDIKPVDSKLAREAHDAVLEESSINAEFAYRARRVLHRHQDCLD